MAFWQHRGRGRMPDYSQYFGTREVYSNPAHMPDHLWGGPQSPRRGTPPGQAPSSVPYQAALVGYVAPSLPVANDPPDSVRQGWTPDAPAIGTYRFVRAPTASEALVGPQYNPADLLGLLV